MDENVDLFLRFGVIVDRCRDGRLWIDRMQWENEIDWQRERSESILMFVGGPEWFN